jgi:DNA-binding NarL/FixJ family response regulator
VRACVIGADEPARRRFARVLGDAGFSVDAGVPSEQTTMILLLLSDATDAERVSIIRHLTQEHAEVPILIVVSTEASNASLRRALLAGVAGIVLDDDVERALVPTARAMLAGQLTVPSTLGRQIAPRPLSYREKQILALVVAGRTNREIANKLYLAESTVKTHLSSAFRKLDARSRSEAVTRIMDPESGYGTTILELANNGAVATA